MSCNSRQYDLKLGRFITTDQNGYVDHARILSARTQLKMHGDKHHAGDVNDE